LPWKRRLSERFQKVCLVDAFVYWSRKVCLGSFFHF
jgi:hypothetical protein